MLLEKSTPTVRTLRIFLFTVIQFCLVGWSQSPSTDIRAVDFRNFSYPWVHPNGWPDHLQWMSLRLEEHVQLLDGVWDERGDSDRAAGAQFSGLTLEGVQYARLQGSGENAIVVLRYDSGGTQNHYWVYIYGNSNGKQKLLGFFYTGDRASYGLYQVFVKDGVLNVRLLDPKFREGDCCSSGYLSYRFRWNGKGFEAWGKPVPGRTETRSRRPVSIFGLPIDQP